MVFEHLPSGVGLYMETDRLAFDAHYRWSDERGPRLLAPDREMLIRHMPARWWRDQAWAPAQWLLEHVAEYRALVDLAEGLDDPVVLRRFAMSARTKCVHADAARVTHEIRPARSELVRISPSPLQHTRTGGVYSLDPEWTQVVATYADGRQAVGHLRSRFAWGAMELELELSPSQTTVALSVPPVVPMTIRERELAFGALLPDVLARRAAACAQRARNNHREAQVWTRLAQGIRREQCSALAAGETLTAVLDLPATFDLERWLAGDVTEEEGRLRRWWTSTRSRFV
jgi:hypothetical protein